MPLQATIFDEMTVIAREQGKALPELNSDLVLLDTAFDSLCFALLVARMEDRTGLDPFATMDGTDLPVTLGDLVALYDHAATDAPRP